VLPGRSLPKRLARGVPIARVLLVGEVALLAGRHLARLDRGERRRLVALVGRSRGRPGSLSASDRRELYRLEPRLFVGTALRRISPVPLPKRLLYGSPKNRARRALSKHT
jgi:hypothetical protein